ncbi:MAG: EF-hand domain-containing protein [Polyangiaceae bacterium]
MTAPTPPSHVDAELLATLDREFSRLAGPDARIDALELQRAIGLKSEYLARRVLAAFDTNKDGTIARDEFIAGVRAVVFGSDREKLWFAFRVHDHDGDGLLDEKELHRMIALALIEDDVVERATQPAELLARTLFAAADKNKDGKISFDEMEAIVRKRPRLLEQMTRAEALWIAPNEDLLARIEGARRPASQRARRFVENEMVPLALLIVWAMAHAVIFAVSLLRFEGTSSAVAIGRALGACLDFDGALILIPVMRRFLTKIRSTFLGRALPIDDAIDFHKVVGHAMAPLALLHSAAFMIAYQTGHARGGLGGMFTTARGLTGTLLLVVFGVMWAFALSPIRRSSRFELFYFTHLLYVAWLVLAIAHAPSFLLWAGVPILGFLIEQVSRGLRRGVATKIVAGQPLRSGVTRLTIERPKGFTFAPGDYVFVRIPEVAKHEWHPFTISSAPESSAITLHVRTLGNWTAALRRVVETRGSRGPMEVFVDGPYGTPSANIFESRFAVLIGAGIGVTPFASILESVVLRANGGRPSNLKRAHFFWLNRDQYSFEWFVSLLRDLEHVDHKALLDIHLCMTMGRAGATSLGLELAREVMHSIGRTDIVTGLRTHTHMGQPDWESLLGFIARTHDPEIVDVYFCGPPGLGDKIQPICARLGMTFRKEKF